MSETTPTTYIPIRDVLARLPGYRPGTQKFRGTVVRYITAGVDGPNGVRVRLKAIKLGRSWLTTEQWVAEFVDALIPADPADHPTAPPPETSAARSRAVNAATKRLEAAGA